MESATIAAEGTPRGAREGDKGQVELVNEHPDQALITVAERRSARMIVVGSHGESPLRGAVLGSTPYTLIHASRTPVLVVRP